MTIHPPTGSGRRDDARRLRIHRPPDHGHWGNVLSGSAGSDQEHAPQKPCLVPDGPFIQPDARFQVNRPSAAAR
jgi:hypothetical protein